VRLGGYAFITDPDKGITEFDTLTCKHCQYVMHIQKRSDVDAKWGFCPMCHGHLCKRCAGLLPKPIDQGGGCTPFEKKLDQYERAHRLHQAMGLVLRAVAVLAVWWAVTVEAAPLIVSWTDNADNETSFELERQLGACGVDRHAWVQIAVLGSNTTIYQDNGLSDGETYCYRVRACNSNGCSAYIAAGATTKRLPKGNEFQMSSLDLA
jgi:hypothetical protein